MLTPDERRLQASYAAHARWAKAPGRGAPDVLPRSPELTARLEDEVDPDRRLTPEELARRVENAHRSHLARTQMTATRARREALEFLAQAQAAQAELAALLGVDADETVGRA